LPFNDLLVHNNYYFLRQVSASLSGLLPGMVISECFSQSKDELIIRFETKKNPLFIKVNVQPSFSCISFPEKFERARKNSVDLFSPIIGQKVLSIRQFNNERSFLLNLTEETALLFKMHGNRSNIIVIHELRVIDLFQKNVESDATLSLEELDRSIDFSFNAFKDNQSNLAEYYFTFGKLVWRYLESFQFSAKPLEDKWRLFQDTISLLEKPDFLISEIDNKIHLSLLPLGIVSKKLTDPVQAANEFYYAYTNTTARTSQKNQLTSALNAKIASNKNYIKKNQEKLRDVEISQNFKIWADLIMANLHAIKPNTSQVELPNFYDQNKITSIKLRPELNPQKNAEIFYRKSKNQKIEIDKLTEAIERKIIEIKNLEEKIKLIQETDDLKSLKQLDSHRQAEVKQKTGPSLPYREVIFKDYKIWIGRDAESNDELTLKYSFKDDLWLHAKDVAGSHVLLKHQAGKNFPKDVIERAAQLAAFYSKRKNESLCPVAMTPKKFVRKRKGDPAGLVVVEREEVIMVEPKG
jgi:predicted ribosome quality control (RQC) complex YloA/Tae2 family protein